MEFTFYKDNRLDGKHTKTAEEIIEAYSKSKYVNWDMPFERKILNFMSEEYGAFDILSEEQWHYLHLERSVYRGFIAPRNPSGE
jgi:hypothetical protein